MDKDYLLLKRATLRRLNGPEILPVLPDDRHAPPSQPGGDGLVSRGFLSGLHVTPSP
jgi:hypothetical protein